MAYKKNSLRLVRCFHASMTSKAVYFFISNGNWETREVSRVLMKTNLSSFFYSRPCRNFYLSTRDHHAPFAPASSKHCMQFSTWSRWAPNLVFWRFRADRNFCGCFRVRGQTKGNFPSPLISTYSTYREMTAASGRLAKPSQTGKRRATKPRLKKNKNETVQET